MNFKIKYVFEIILVLFISCFLIYNKLIIYGVKMGMGQMRIVLNARPINECLIDQNYPDSLRSKLLLIGDIRRFAIDSLGFHDSPNYTTVYNQDNKPAIWVLTACDPFALKAKEWKFPVVGAVPYKGFFNKTEAEIEQRLLIAEGLDTKLGTTNGWSTLGWLKDPILSNMLYHSEGDLAELIIHELTHSTIFIKNDVKRSENLANFIGEAGARKFLIHKFGLNSPQYTSYTNKKLDELVYNNYILKSANRLDSLYKSFTSDTKNNERKRKKEKIIFDIVRNVSNLNLHDKLKYIRISKRAITCKNAFFMEFIRYDSEYNFFDNELKNLFDNNLKDYLIHLKKY